MRTGQLAITSTHTLSLLHCQANLLNCLLADQQKSVYPHLTPQTLAVTPHSLVPNSTISAEAGRHQQYNT